MVTITDIAKKAKVSISTVSYAINGTRPISEETRQRIFAVMEELGYRPNAMARGLASKKSRVIALLFPGVGMGLGMTALGFFSFTAEAALKVGYNLVLWPELMSNRSLKDHLKNGLVDGVIVMEVSIQDERVDLLRKLNFPFSMIGRTADPRELSYVDIDIRQSMYDAVNYLVELGHRHIAFINAERVPSLKGHGPTVRSQTAFAEATWQVPGVKSIIRSVPVEPNAGTEIVSALLEEDPDLTAIITHNDYAAPGITQAIIKLGYKIPEDFSIIVGPTSPHMAEIVSPPLTSLDLPIEELSRLGVRQLVHKLEGQEPELTQVLIPCHLTIRGSTGPCHIRK
jgi:DNA-binding LacI/PurR family transcriptional regulator